MPMPCPHCASDQVIKLGFQRGKQRHRCKACRKTFSYEPNERAYPLALREKACQLYLEGVGIRSIARLLGVSHPTVIDWIRKAAKAITPPPLPEYVEIMELDEMWHFVQKKAKNFGCGLRMTVKPDASLISNSVHVVWQA
jgi:transposase